MLLAVFSVDLVVCIGTRSRGVRGVVCVIGVCSGTRSAGVYGVVEDAVKVCVV